MHYNYGATAVKLWGRGAHVVEDLAKRPPEPDLVIYLQRLIIHGVPGSDLRLFAVGVTGQAGYSILIVGERLRMLLPRNSSANSHFLNSDGAATIIAVVCICLYAMVFGDHVDILRIFTRLPIVLLGYGLPKRTFPLPEDDLTIQLGNVFDSKPLRVRGAIYAVGTLLLWLSIVRSIVEIKKYMVCLRTPHISQGSRSRIHPHRHQNQDAVNNFRPLR